MINQVITYFKLGHTQKGDNSDHDYVRLQEALKDGFTVSEVFTDTSDTVNGVYVTVLLRKDSE